jgi:dTDP-glucose 4,6-dehydratase
MVEMICDILDRVAPKADGKSHRNLISHVTDRPGHDRRYAISIEKIRTKLGWKPSETLATGLEKTVSWYLQNREWSEAITRKTYARTRLGMGNGQIEKQIS